ncbi:MAG: dTDP-4-dehydrorhamnose 3,5-epimerase family protein [Candidatus Zixiibacteriota bacterium]
MSAECNIDGVIIKHLKKNVDARGWLIEMFRSDEYPDGYSPAMSYISMTSPGVTRGPHEHRKQTDYFCFFGSSEFRIFLWDNRPGSPTCGNKCVLMAGEDNMICFTIPPGVVHAYKNIGKKEGLVFNAPDRLYRGEGKKEESDEIRYEDGNGGERFLME